MQFEGFFFFFNGIYIFIYFQFLAALGLCCCTQAFSGCDERGLLFVAGHDLLSDLKGFLILAKGKSCMRGKLLKEMSAISLKNSFCHH